MGYIMELREKIGSRPLIMAGASVLVFNELGHLLLQKRADSLDWGTIGGSLEPGESLEEAAHRELWEESGLKANTLQLITVISGADAYYQYPNGDEVYNVTAVFKAICIEGSPVLMDDEGLELRYFDLNEPIPNLNPYAAHVLSESGFLQNVQKEEAKA